MKKRLVYLVLSALILFSTVFIPTIKAQAANVITMNTPVSGGSAHTITVQKSGMVWAWGSNSQSQLGRSPDVLERLLVPMEVNDELSAVSACAGDAFSLVRGYGSDVYVLGSGNRSSAIYRVNGLTDIVAIAAGQSDGLALDRDGVLWQWTIGNRPSRVSGPSGIAAIAAGGAHFFALTFSGEVWAWGGNWSGQLGDGTTTDVARPKKIESLANIIYITAGFSHTLAVANDGSVYAWGSNTNGQLGDGTRDAHYLPIKVNGITDAVQVSAGYDSSMVLTKKHEIYTWGYGEYGQLGDGTRTISQFTPMKVATEGVPAYIASGLHHNLYVTEAGDLYAWGRNNYGQIGIGDSENTTTGLVPEKVLDGIISGEYDRNPFEGASDWAVSDIDNGRQELVKLFNLNVLPPMLWGKYQENVTRAEFASLLVNTYEEINGKSLKYADKTNFTDIKNHIYEVEIRKAFEIETIDGIQLVSGISETKFNPEGFITRQEAAKMICTFFAIMEDIIIVPDVTFMTKYRDANSVAQWAVPFVAYAYEYEIMRGGADEKFDPHNNLTREQTLAMVYRMIYNNNWV